MSGIHRKRITHFTERFLNFEDYFVGIWAGQSYSSTHQVDNFLKKNSLYRTWKRPRPVYRFWGLDHRPGSSPEDHWWYPQPLYNWSWRFLRAWINHRWWSRKHPECLQELWPCREVHPGSQRKSRAPTDPALVQTRGDRVRVDRFPH